MGEALEFYVKDLFCDSLRETNATTRNRIYSEHFSYIGNEINPPDFMIKQGDAIEVKKIESLRTDIALNSSYPKDKIYSSSPMITAECRDCENWDEKDLIYAIGVPIERKLKVLWFIHGSCYAAGKETYERVRDQISSGINELPNVELSETTELGRVNRVDPLGITYLRVRGMWGIKNPIRVFEQIASVNTEDDLSLNAIMLKEKYLSFPEEDRRKIESLISENLTVEDVELPSPNNPANLLDAKIIKFRRVI